jgi:alpha-tubulin suppressor-like RCC1 family protein
MITAGNDHTCGVDAGGAVYCWGRNDDGQLGDGDSCSSPVANWTPQQVLAYDSGALVDQVAVAAGAYHTCARSASGAVSCWGDDGEGELGIGIAYANKLCILGSSTNTREARTVTISGVVDLAAGDSHTCARTGGGGTSCWGLATSGQIGNGRSGASAQTVFLPYSITLSP